MKNNKEEKKLENRLDDLNLEEVLEKKRKKKRIAFIALIAICIIAFASIMTFRYFYGNNKHLAGDIKITSSSKLYSETQPTDIEDIGDGALFIIFIDGIKKNDFLAQYEVLEISINDEKVNLEEVTYRHLNNSLSIRLHSENYTLEKGNTVKISIRQKESGRIINKRLYHTTEVL